MRVRICLLLASLWIAAESQAAVGVRLITGLTDTGAERWDGSARATGARITKIDPRRFGVDTKADGFWIADLIGATNSWKLSTSDVGEVLPGVPSQRVDESGAQNESTAWTRTDPNLANKRKSGKMKKEWSRHRHAARVCQEKPEYPRVVR